MRAGVRCGRRLRRWRKRESVKVRRSPKEHHAVDATRALRLSVLVALRGGVADYLRVTDADGDAFVGEPRRGDEAGDARTGIRADAQRQPHVASIAGAKRAERACAAAARRMVSLPRQCRAIRGEG